MTNAEQLQARCLSDLARRAEETPDAPALLGPDEPAVSFLALMAGIARVAQILRTAGVRPGDVAAVAMPDGPGFLTALLGAIEAGAAAPLDWNLTEAEFRSRLTLLRPSILVLRSRADGHAAAVAQSLGIPVVAADSAGSEVPDISPQSIRVPENCALVMQTSATTGEAKLVPFTHANLHAICAAALRGLGLRADDRYLSLMPLHHILGFSSALGQLMAGGSAACTGFDGQRFRAWIEELQPTWYAGGPALHQAILEMAKADPEPFHRSHLRFVRCGSGAGSIALLDSLERVLQVDVINGYGLTETGPATNTPPQQPRKPGSVGRSIGPEIAIMDAHGNLLAPGSEGEVVLRGDVVMEGYLGAAHLNHGVFVDGWFRTGDLGRMDRDGDLFITGRIKEIINRGGESISPLEIDHALAEHPGIIRAASFGVAHPTLGEDIVAAVVLRAGAKAVASQIRAFLAERLSRSKVPGRIWFVESIALSSSGKPLRDALRTRYQIASQPHESPAASGPQDESTILLRQRIGAAWARVLDCDFPGPDDNFFAMGGDSLSAARLVTRLKDELRIDDASLDLPAFLDSPTFSHLMHMVARKTADQAAPYHQPPEIRFENVSAVCLQSSGQAPPLFFFPGEDLGPWSVRHLVRSLAEDQPFFVLRHHIADAADFPAIASRFVTLISRIWPSGPIVLVGHCYGGILAYEVAQRMLAKSRSEVAVVLVDVATPGYRRVRRNLSVALGAILRGEGRKLASELASHIRFVRGKGKRSNPVLVAPQVAAPAPADVPANPEQAVGPTPGGPTPGGPTPGGPTPGGPTPGGIVLGTYVPPPFPGLLVNVMAGGNEFRDRVLRDSRTGWRELAQGPFEERCLEGSHNTILGAENAPALADAIRSAVEAMAAAGTAVP